MPQDYIEINFAKLTKDFFTLIEKLFSAIWKLLIYLIHLLFKYYYISLISVIIILFLYIQSLYIQKDYTSTFLVRSNATDQQYIMEQVDKIGDLLNNKSYEQLHNILQLPANQVKLIKDIKAFWRIDVDGDSIADYIDYTNSFHRSPKDSLPVRLTDGFVIRVTYSENFPPQSLTSLEKNLLKYLASLDYVKQQQQIKLHNLNLLSKEMLNQYKKLDSATKMYYTFLFKQYLPQLGENQIVFLNNGQVTNPKNFIFYKDQIKIYLNYLETLKEKQISERAISIISPALYRENKIISSSNTKYMLYIFLGTLAVLLFIDNWNKLKKLRE